MQRKCRYKPLSAQPLCQVRLSPVPQMDQYIPAIQEAFRRRGFPIERAGKVHQVTFNPSGGTPVQLMERRRWDYRNKDETWSVLLMRDTVVLQTTAYTRSGTCQRFWDTRRMGLGKCFLRGGFTARTRIHYGNR